MAKFVKDEANLFAIWNVNEEDQERTELWRCEIKKDAVFDEQQNAFTYDVGFLSDKKFPDEVRTEDHLYKKDELFMVPAKVITKMEEEKYIKITSKLSKEELPFPRLRLTPGFYNLLDENHEIVINNGIINFPKKPHGSIYSILNKYKDKCKGDELVIRVLEYVTKIFNCTLPLMLLYPQERQRYKDIEKDKSNTKTWDKIFGMEHLSRLLIKLPELVSFNKNEKNDMKLFHKEIQKLVNWLDKEYDLTP